MPTCERCWAQAYGLHPNQAEAYARLVRENVCTPKQQAETVHQDEVGEDLGVYWACRALITMDELESQP